MTLNKMELFKIQMKYDKLNTKYNRLWEQVTNFILFIFASFVAYSVLYLGNFGYISFGIFLTKSLLHMVILIFPIIILGTILLTLLFTTRSELYKLLKKFKILD